jgi:hypothetical protein
MKGIAWSLTENVNRFTRKAILVWNDTRSALRQEFFP